MKNTLLLVFFILSSMPIFATHFVGGDFQICQTGPNTFEVTLRVYRDCLPGNSTVISPTSVFIRDNVIVDIKYNNIPLSLKRITSKHKCNLVIEVNANYVINNNINIGDYISII